MLPGVPGIHALEGTVGLVYGQNRTLGKDIQLAVRDDSGNLDNRILHGIETGHLEVYPDKVVVIPAHCYLLPS